MDLHVKQFTVRYQGKDYGPGSIIYGMPNDEAEKLIEESNGTIEALPERDNVVMTTDNSNDDGLKDGLPSLDPSLTVKDGKK